VAGRASRPALSRATVGGVFGTFGALVVIREGTENGARGACAPSSTFVFARYARLGPRPESALKFHEAKAAVECQAVKRMPYRVYLPLQRAHVRRGFWLCRRRGAVHTHAIPTSTRAV
jgi:hypothetical protein